MRLDLFLKKCFLIKRRSDAKRACDNGIVKLDDHVAKAGRDVVPGQRLAIAFLDRFLEVEVIALPTGNVAKGHAHRYHRLLRDEPRDVSDF